jgi:hypothetical protein
VRDAPPPQQRSARVVGVAPVGEHTLGTLARSTGGPSGRTPGCRRAGLPVRAPRCAPRSRGLGAGAPCRGRRGELSWRSRPARVPRPRRPGRGGGHPDIQHRPHKRPQVRTSLPARAMRAMFSWLVPRISKGGPTLTTRNRTGACNRRRGRLAKDPYEPLGGYLSRSTAPSGPSPRVRFGRAQNGSYAGPEREPGRMPATRRARQQAEDGPGGRSSAV